MLTEFVPRHGPTMQKKHAGLPGRRSGDTMNTVTRLLEALPALLLAVALLMPALAVLA